MISFTYNNKQKCIDCSSKNPKWASVSLGTIYIFLNKQKYLEKIIIFKKKGLYICMDCSARFNF